MNNLNDIVPSIYIFEEDVVTADEARALIESNLGSPSGDVCIDLVVIEAMRKAARGVK